MQCSQPVLKHRLLDLESSILTIRPLHLPFHIDVIFCYLRYDYIHLHQVYNHTYLNITDEQWRKLVDLADWVEYNKYSKEMIGDIGGGILVNEIASSFSKVAAKQSKTKVCLSHLIAPFKPCQSCIHVDLSCSIDKTVIGSIRGPHAMCI